MLLFLDVVSPIPEFYLIEDNKLVFNSKITENHNEKLSDNIFKSFDLIDKQHNILKKLSKLSITIGPGSYTSLRVGSAFISGLQILRSIPFYPLSIPEIIKFHSTSRTITKCGVYLESSNNQKFFCKINKYNKIEYYKIDNGDFNFHNDINKILYNNKKINVEKKEIDHIQFSFVEEILNNFRKIKFNKDQKIEPIYISNNKILN